SEVMIRQEMDVKEKSRDEVYAEMERNLEVMEKAIEDSLKGVQSVTGLTGGDAVLIQEYMKNENPLSGHLLLDAVSKAMGTNESMPQWEPFVPHRQLVVQDVFREHYLL